MADDTSNVGSGASGDFWDQAAFAVKGDKGTATGDGWVVGGAVASGSAGGGSTIAGGFLLDPETAEGMVRKANWVADQMQEQERAARELTSAKPPAEDPGSRAFQDVAVAMYEMGADHMTAQWKRYRDIAEKLQKALDVYNETDEQAGKDVKKSGGGENESGMF